MRRSSPFTLAVFICSAALSGCPAPEEGPEPPHLLYSQDVQSLDNPYPDLRLFGDEGFRSRTDWYKAYLPKTAVKTATVGLLKTWSTQASVVKGFGNLGLILMNPSEPLDPASVAGTAVRLRKTAEGYEVLEADVAVEHAHDALAGTGKLPDGNFPNYILIRPSVILPEGDEGLLVIKKGMKTAAGAELGRGRDFEKEEGSREKIAAAAKTLGVSEDDILLALPLRAEQVTAPMRSLAAYTVTMAPPAYVIPPKGSADNGPVGVWSAGDSDWSVMKDFLEKYRFARPATAVSKVIVGTFKSRELREAGIWKPEYLSDPDAAPLADLYFTVTLPSGPKPAGGYAAVIGAHGLNGNNSVIYNGNTPFCLEVGELLAKSNIACIGIDAASHGRRGSSFDFFAIDDLTRARDNFRQSAFDMMQLSRLAQTLDLDGDSQPDLSSDLGYFGNSLGGIMGANFLSFDPRVTFGVLNVPGAGLSNILTSPVIRDQIGLLLVAKSNLVYQSSDYYGAIPVFRVIGQLMLERADPINLAQAMDARPVLIQMGVDDLTIPNLTTIDLAKTMKAPELKVNQTSASGIRALSRMEPKILLGPVAAEGYNGHNIFWEFPSAPPRRQAAKFLQSKGTEFIVE